MKRVQMVPPPPKENQTNQQQQASEANRRVQFNEEIEVRTLLKGNQQSKSKQQPGNPGTTRREELQSSAHTYDKKFQELVEEFNTKTGIDYKIIEDSDHPNKLRVLYQQAVYLLEEKIRKQLQRQNKNCTLPNKFRWRTSEWSKEVQSKFGPSLACIYKQKYATSNEFRTKQNSWSSELQREQQKYPTDNPVTQTVQNGATTRGQETENVSETSSAKQRREEMINKLISNLKPRSMQLEQARFEQRRLELEMQLKETETKHRLLEEERQLERKVKRTALENDDIRSQSTTAQEKSPFNWTPQKRDVSDWASRIDNLLTPDRSTSRFDVTPKVNRNSRFTQHRRSRNRSSSVEHRDVSPRAGILRYKSGHAGSSILPKLKLNNFDGNPLELLELSCMFIATVV